ncbi:hypothetical protein [Candidatus Clavichlamydia salmonicola]|uniref:hypothetical protein n=1 Tax=Candidatus Clavichlamydia salmonicola TaxID=469812 RepID=UPI001891E5E2|nr:hypothetical protein [Candidatus Clavichlamydia salmonicola]
MEILRLSALNPTKHAKNHRLYILTGLNLLGSSLRLLSIINFISNSAMQNHHSNPVQTLAIT